eukprot:gene1170-1481_t
MNNNIPIDLTINNTINSQVSSFPNVTLYSCTLVPSSLNVYIYPNTYFEKFNLPSSIVQVNNHIKHLKVGDHLVAQCPSGYICNLTPFASNKNLVAGNPQGYLTQFFILSISYPLFNGPHEIEMRVQTPSSNHSFSMSPNKGPHSQPCQPSQVKSYNIFPPNSSILNVKDAPVPFTSFIEYSGPIKNYSFVFVPDESNSTSSPTFFTPVMGTPDNQLLMAILPSNVRKSHIVSLNDTFPISPVSSFTTIELTLTQNANCTINPLDTHLTFFTPWKNKENEYQFKFPFGCKSGTVKSFVYENVFPIPDYFNGIVTTITYFNRTSPLAFLSGPSNPIVKDVYSPQINNIEFIPLSNNILVIRINASDDVSGVFKINVGNQYQLLGKRDLVSGSLTRGIFERYFNVFLDRDPQPQITIYDGTNKKSVYSKYIIPGFVSIPTLPYFVSDKFKNPSWRREKNVFNAVWSDDLEMFAIDFSIYSTNIFNGEIDYNLFINPIQYSSSMLKSILGEKANLKSISNYADQMSPLVTDIVAINGTNVFISNSLNTIGWDITIEDSYNGFLFGRIVVSSEYNMEVLNLTFTSYERSSGDLYKGVYRFTTTLNPSSCRSQTFYISQLLLMDKGGYTSSLNGESMINSMIKVMSSSDLQITANCNSTVQPDQTYPYLEQFNIQNPSLSTDQNYQISFTTNDDDSGISVNHIPLVYLTGIGGQMLVVDHCTKDLNGFSYQCLIPKEQIYQFHQDEIMVSIYGIYDNYLNVRGYSSRELAFYGFQNIISSTIKRPPLLERASPCEYSGGMITIYGRGLASNPVNNFFYGVFNETLKRIPVTPVSSTVLLAYVPPSIDRFSLYTMVQENGQTPQYSNTLDIIPVAPTIIEPPPFTNNPCSNISCGISEQGTCVNGVCNCNYPWTGPNCQDQIVIEVTPPIIDPKRPDIIIEYSNKTTRISSIISILSLREISIQGEIINQFNFTDWTYQNTTNRQDFFSEYLYTTNFTHKSVVTQVKVWIQFFPIQKNVSFAGKSFQMDSGATKYKISLSSYSFTNSLSKLQLVMSTKVENLNDQESCTMTEIGDVDPLFQYIKLKINNNSVYGKFMKLAVVDDQVVVISNQLLDESSSSISKEDQGHKGEAIVGINIVNYRESVLLDPDFRLVLLFDDKNNHIKNNTNSICSSSSPKNKTNSITTTRLAGIIVGGAVFAATLTVIVSYVVIKKRKINIERKQLELKLKQMNQQQQNK